MFIQWLVDCPVQSPGYEPLHSISYENALMQDTEMRQNPKLQVEKSAYRSIRFNCSTVAFPGAQETFATDSIWHQLPLTVVGPFGVHACTSLFC